MAAEVTPEEIISIPVTNRPTGNIDLSYVRINLPTFERGTYSTPTQEEYKTQINESNEFIVGTYPVAKDDFTGEDKGAMRGATEIGKRGIYEDLGELQFRAHFTDGRGTGIVHPDYFEYHSISPFLDDAKGVFSPHLDPIISSIKHPTTTARELGHQFGLYVEEEAYDIEEFQKERIEIIFYHMVIGLNVRI